MTNPLTRFNRWLGWSQSQYLRFGGWLLTLLAFGSAMALSYSSLYFIASSVLGFDGLIAYAFPLTIDALVGASYITLWQLAGRDGFRCHRYYVIGLGLLAAGLTLGGNALHGPLVHGQIPNPLPWWAEMIGSSVPAVTLIGAGHSMSIMLSARRAEFSATAPAGVGEAGQSAVEAGPDASPVLPEAHEETRKLPGTSRETKSGKASRVRALLARELAVLLEDGTRRAELIKRVARRAKADETYVRKLANEVAQEARASRANQGLDSRDATGEQGGAPGAEQPGADADRSPTESGLGVVA
jgi:hypothetical protein